VTAAAALSRPSSQGPNRPSSRLQERLAKAMISSEGQKSPKRQSLEVSSQLENPVPKVDTARTSLESKQSELLPETVLSPQQIPTDNTKDEAAVEKSLEPVTKPVPEPTSGTPIGDISSGSARQSLESAHSRPSIDAVQTSSPSDPVPIIEEPTLQPERSLSPASMENELQLLQTTHSQALEDHKNETQAYLERIDALQSKIIYLSKQLEESSKTAAAEAEPGSMDKKIAEKDAQIATLMEEGQVLSKKELTHMNAIKKLRSKTAEMEKEKADLKRIIARAEQQVIEQKERASRAEAAEKATNEKLRIVAKIERDIDTLKAEKEAAGIMIADLRIQLEDSVVRAEEAEKKAQSGALEAERRVVANLKDEISDLKIEAKLSEDRAKAEVKAIQEEAARQQEKAKVAEVELKGEIAVSNQTTRIVLYN
jgi:TATA element modulatory factor